ncbi:CGGC domain-containing protein [Paraclostridium sordellii]|uniref:CGGC domain-containing protein n=1 Tax=Paraclostridium sordellii TaxID=1505 RepID=A0A0C7RSV7_PARSO|nr:CGGC domain-containing protein [Paeniclostridium sordellii]CEN80548.1 CGGC domain-containing protein [[Clostridium] sordellii] [Paeniclostridium sordellii]CEO30870.1 CGGC domain-containing protein [[Clostridium] sordellii] [Paeniclostridium sordellii]CEQ05402.1 CGGC domain-containing protein [[Clostridium] sordellii] [Paeniclostridium sordellii]CEQ16292.1 CGGC domain-containing protein [[Clostridium] sordellii] [Paeniclostridium sordellii]
MNIAIMACRKLSNKCSGTGCFNAYNNSQDAFECYKDEKPILKSFFYCSGCKKMIFEDEDWENKINQLKRNDVDVIHIALCAKVECRDYDKHERLLSKEGFKVIHGTHK